MKFRNIAVLIIIFGAYLLINQINYTRQIYDLGTSLDSKIPFIPLFVLFYLSYFILILLPLTEKSEDEVVLNYSIAAVISFLFFVLLPSTIYRPLIQNNNIFSGLLNLVQNIDHPYNLFHSLHATLLTLSFIFLLKNNKKTAYYLLPLFILSLVSTLFIKQNYLLDLISGILLALLTLFIAKKVKQVM